MLKAFGMDLGFTLLIGLVVTILFALLIVAIYRPRISRGSFWVPVFGWFGGTPTLYLHSRPASVCGLFFKSRRRA